MANNKEVTIKANKYYKRKLFVRIVKLIFLLLFAIISIVYFVVYMIYNGSGFTIRVDKDMLSSHIFLSLDEDGKDSVRELKAQAVEYMDNISINWIDKDVDKQSMGAHNGDNYFAYSFYLFNKGQDEINYWYQVSINDVLLKLDEAIRVMIYRNGERTVYAKLNSTTHEPEKDTKAFYDNGIPVLEEVKKFKPGTKDKFTVVVWIEGDDPDCKNELIGGGIEMQMDIREERIIR